MSLSRPSNNLITGRKAMFHLEQFISDYVTRRPVSMFETDVENNREALTERIQGKSVLVPFHI